MTLSSIDLMWRWEVNQEVLSQYDPQFRWFDVKGRSEPRGSQSVWPSVLLIWCEGKKWTKRFSISMTVNSVDLMWRWEVNQEVLSQRDPQFHWFDVKVRSEPRGSQSVWPSFPLIWCKGEKWTKRFSISMTLSSLCMKVLIFQDPTVCMLLQVNTCNHAHQDLSRVVTLVSRYYGFAAVCEYWWNWAIFPEHFVSIWST